MLDSEFIKQTIDFLEKSDLNLKFPELRRVEYTHDSSRITLKMFDNLFVYNNLISQNFIIKNMIIFSLFDGYLDIKNDALIGLSFKGKYEKLNHSTDIEIIVKETYRILKLIRNTIVHNATGITINGDSYKFNYKHPKHSTNFNIEITNNTLSLLYTIVIILVKEEVLYPNSNYYSGILRRYYRDLKTEIDQFGNLEDDIKSDLLDISSDIKLKRIVRYLVENSKYNQVEGKIVFEKYDPGFMEYGVDYQLDVNNEIYIIPEEALGENNSIEMSAVDLWKLDCDYGDKHFE